MKLFVDENLPPRLARGLAAFFADIHEVVHCLDKFGRRGVTDEEWIVQLGGERNWCVLSGDLNIPRKRPSRTLFLNNDLVGFFPAPAVAKLPFERQAARILTLCPLMEQTRRAMSRGCFELPITGQTLKPMVDGEDRLMIAPLLAILLATAPPASVAVEAPGLQGPLAGTLLQKEREDAPVVLVLPGSGPTDRNGNNPLGVAANSSRLLAEELAADGVSSLRIDKRGLFGSKAAIADPNAVTVADYVADTRAWIAVARAKTGARCVWLLGHSEGGVIALAAAHEEGVCGLVLVATPGRPLGEVMREQFRANPANAPILADAETAIDTLEAGERVDVSAMHPGIRSLFDPAVQGFLIGLFALDPAKLIADAPGPVLIVQGGRDIQVGTADAERLKAAAPAAELALFPAANHVLKDVAGDDRAANLATYADPSLPLAKGLAERIAGFVKERSVPSP